MATEYLPASQSAQQDLVLLHGWGSNRDIWRPLLACLRPWANLTLVDLPGLAPGVDSDEPAEIPGLLEQVLAASPARAVYLGWSLGGQLALELAARHPQRVAAVVTVCSNPRFVAARGWPGMDSGEFGGFRTAYAADPAAALRRFGSLQVRGSRRQRELLRRLSQAQRDVAGAELALGLAWLGQLDQRQILQELQQPQLHLLAECDGLVPAGLEQALRELLGARPGAEVRLLPGACHLAPLDTAPAIAAHTREFLAESRLLRAGQELDDAPAKKEVASSFSRAAVSYDSVAGLQREVGQQLLGYLDRGPVSASVVLDLGCGTGFFRPELNALYPDATYIGLDLAPGMVEYARARSRGEGAWLVGDAESLPLATDSVDIIFSSLAIQWCHRPEHFLAELARVLKPGGQCVFSTLGPDTLRELRRAWAAVDAHQHVNTFLPAAALATVAGKIPAIGLKLETERHTMRYRRVGELLAELKNLGAHNMNRGRRTGLTTRKSLQGMLRAYEDWRSDGLLPATYDVIFGEVKKA